MVVGALVLATGTAGMLAGATVEVVVEVVDEVVEVGAV